MNKPKGERWIYGPHCGEHFIVESLGDEAKAKVVQIFKTSYRYVGEIVAPSWGYSSDWQILPGQNAPNQD